LDRETIRLVTAAARHVEEHGLSAGVLDALRAAGVGLVIDWHPTVPDCWRATVEVDGRSAPLIVDPDATKAAVRALRAAAVHDVEQGPQLPPVMPRRGPGGSHEKPG